MKQASERIVSIHVMALAVVLAAGFGTNDVYAAKGRDSPSYTLQVLSLPAGFTAASEVNINDRHEIVGTVRVGLSGWHSQAVYWADATAAPVLLPCPTSEPCESRATGINNNGVISGSVDQEAVLWHPTGGSWTLEALPNPCQLDETSWTMANDVLDDGTAGGSCDPTVTTFALNEIPVVWGAYTSEPSELPVPEAFLDWYAGLANQGKYREVSTDLALKKPISMKIVWSRAPAPPITVHASTSQWPARIVDLITRRLRCSATKLKMMVPPCAS